MRVENPDFVWKRFAAGFIVPVVVWPLLLAIVGRGQVQAASDTAFFQEKVAPIFAEQCVKCHGPEKQKGALRLDSFEGIAAGGETGLLMVPGKAEQSLLIKAVRREGDLAMPPKTKLADEQLAILEQWVRAGALMPGSKINAATNGETKADAPELKPFLQAWYRAETLPLKDGAAVYHWPDSSPHKRDLHPSAGVFEGAGKPPVFAKAGKISGHAAVKFEVGTGLAASAEKPVQIQGDAAYTMVMVANLQRSEHPGGMDVIFGFGEPLEGSNAAPGRPAAGLLQLDRTAGGQHRLDHAGGFARDARIGRPGSFASFYGFPVIITLVKQPGPMAQTSALYINGEIIDTAPAGGVRAAPDIRHRKDFSIFMGHAFKETGSIVGEIAEIALFNTALSSEQRSALEKSLAAHFGIKLSAEAPMTEIVSAAAREHWAFRKNSRPKVPNFQKAESKALVRTEIDAFLLSKLDENGLGYAPEASKETLLRRLYLDLTGLPPSYKERREFLEDGSEKAYEKLADQLISSNHFGERWGRHWLDLAGYVDVLGNDQNAEQIILGQSKWKYRDYVVRAFNNNKRFDEFLREQIAGDEMADWRNAAAFTPEIREKLIATGYLRLAIDDTHEVDLNKTPFRYQVLYDTVQLVGNSLFGLTTQCARCHDHKFDPIPQRDYFSFMGLFTPAFNPHNWLQPKDRELPEVSPAEQKEIREHNARLDRELKPLRDELSAFLAAGTNKLVETRLKNAPELTQVKQALALPPEKRTPALAGTIKKHENDLKISREQIAAVLSGDEKGKLAELEKNIGRFEKERKGWDTIRAFFEQGAPPRDFIFVRGDHENPSQRVAPGFLSTLAPSVEKSIVAGNKSRETSGRRLAFAEWVTDTNGAPASLVSRVFLNRVWQQIFAEGLVRTPDNFGRNGAAPTHPELLEWLVSEFHRNEWRLKPIIKMMVMSRAYRQSSAVGEIPLSQPAQQLDPDNKLLWRMPLRRLESEIIRDSLLQVSGKLDRQMFGPAVPLQTLPDGSIALVPDEKLPTPTAKYRRSLYLMTRRNFHLPILASFDQPTINGSCARRSSSSVVLQSLAMLNDAFVLEQARFFAQRVEDLAGFGEDQLVKTAFELAFAREPSKAEIEMSREYLQDQQKNFSGADLQPGAARREAFVSFCHMLLNASEFLYVR